MAETPLIGPVLLDSTHDTDSFDCGKAPLNDFLKRFALQNQRGGGARTYVIARGNVVMGYFSLSPGSVEPDWASDRAMKGQPKHPVPVVLLARLALDQSEQGKGLGKHLLLDAFRRAVAGSDVIGGRALLIHAKDEEAKAFYLKYDAEPSPIDPMHLFILMKDLKRALGQ
jgi:GNAT superfamily N-acetyltransferase